MQLYYAPSFMALCITDCKRVEWYHEQILRWFRDGGTGYILLSERLGHYSLDQFLVRIRDEIVRCPPLQGENTSRILQALKSWYFEGLFPLRNEYVALSTEKEKAVFCRFFAFLQDEYPDAFGLPAGYYARAAYAARALLSGSSLSESLGATTPEECRHLIDILSLLEREFPPHFPKSWTEPLKEHLGKV